MASTRATRLSRKRFEINFFCEMILRKRAAVLQTTPSQLDPGLSDGELVASQIKRHWAFAKRRCFLWESYVCHRPLSSEERPRFGGAGA
jgi:hypothetical protein